MFTKYFCCLTFFISIVAISSCKKEYEGIENVDDAKIQAYIKNNNLQGFKPDPSGFYYQVTNPTTVGDTLKNTDSVFYDFDIKSLTGVVYQAYKPLVPNANFVGYVTPLPFRTALRKLYRGGSVKLIIPSHLAFGKNGSGNIPSNEIIFSNITTFKEFKRHKIDSVLMDKFVADNNLTVVKDPSRARYQIITAGTGTDEINLRSTITAKYTVRYLDGTIIPQTSNEITSRMDQLFMGWQLILPGKLTVGGKMRLIIPSDLGRDVKPLDFDIEITKVTND